MSSSKGEKTRRALWFLLAIAAATCISARPGRAAEGRPNILVIWGDDIGWFSTSAYNHGMMGYRTPNIDGIASGGMLFTDAYGQQSCTAGRSAFITGQSPFRTGLLKVGLPGAKEGLSGEDPTIAELLKPLGYATGQFGKNHLGDRNEFLPTNHGLDENRGHRTADQEADGGSGCRVSGGGGELRQSCTSGQQALTSDGRCGAASSSVPVAAKMSEASVNKLARCSNMKCRARLPAAITTSIGAWAHFSRR
jgi:hypothetical protein